MYGCTDGQVQIGDEMLAVNSICVENIGRDGVMAVIKSSKEPLRVVMRRHVAPSSPMMAHMVDDAFNVNSSIETVVQVSDALDHTAAHIAKTQKERRTGISENKFFTEEIPSLSSEFSNLSQSFLETMQRVDDLRTKKLQLKSGMGPI
jgi:hypothetical protein